VYSNDLLSGDGEEPEGVVVAQRLFVRERKPGQRLQRIEIVGSDVRKLLAVEGDVPRDAADERPQSLELQAGPRSSVEGLRVCRRAHRHILYISGKA
jgi:hypothetical protein